MPKTVRYLAALVLVFFYGYVAMRRFEVRERHGLPGRTWTDVVYA